MKHAALTLAGVLACSVAADAQFGVAIRTRNGSGAAVDRLQVQTGADHAAVSVKNAFLEIAAVPAPTLSPAATGRIYFDGAQFRASVNGGPYVPLAGGGGGIASIEGQTGPAVDLAAAGAGLAVTAGNNVITYTLTDLWVNASGDTMTGTLHLPAAGLTIGGQTLHLTDGNGPNAGSNLVHWDNLVGVPAGFADGTDDGAGGGGGGISSIEGQAGPAIDVAAVGPGLSVAAANNVVTFTLEDQWVDVDGDTITDTLTIFPDGLTTAATGLWVDMPAGGQNAGVFVSEDDTGSGVPTIWCQQVHDVADTDGLLPVSLLSIGLDADSFVTDAIGVFSQGLGFESPSMLSVAGDGDAGLALLTLGDAVFTSATELQADVLVDGNHTVLGAKAAAQRMPDGSYARFYAMESRDLEYVASGTAALEGGVAEVKLEPSFVEGTSEEVEYRILVTPRGECNGLYVAARSRDRFTVRELLAGAGDVGFDWIAIGRRRGYESRPDDEALNAQIEHARRTAGRALETSASVIAFMKRKR